MYDYVLSSDGTRLNPYCVQSFRIAKDFPLWRNKINNYYKTQFVTVNLGPIENYIGEVKWKFNKFQ